MTDVYYFWDSVSDSVMQELDSAFQPTVTYTRESSPYGPLISEQRGNQFRQYHFDALGSTRALTDENGDVTDTFAYDAWGNEQAHVGSTSTPFVWAGRLGCWFDDASEKYSIRRDVYQPSTASWATGRKTPRSRSGSVGLDSVQSLISQRGAWSISPASARLFALNAGCTPAEQVCLDRALAEAKDRLLKNPDCLSRILCKGKRSKCGDELRECILATLASGQITCAGRGDPGCHKDEKNQAHSDTPCGLLKGIGGGGIIFPPPPPSFAGITCPPCRFPLAVANDCSACPDDLLKQSTTTLCRDTAPGLSGNCDATAVAKLAAILVHEASHSCVGGHDTTGGKDSCDPCGRPDANDIEASFQMNCK